MPDKRMIGIFDSRVRASVLLGTLRNRTSITTLNNNNPQQPSLESIAIPCPGKA